MRLPWGCSEAIFIEMFLIGLIAALNMHASLPVFHIHNLLMNYPKGLLFFFKINLAV